MPASVTIEDNEAEFEASEADEACHARAVRPARGSRQRPDDLD